MPVTFPAHSAAVLPLKVRWPHRFDGVALVVGSTAPDQAYAVYGWLHVPATHSWGGLLWFVLPMALLETWLCRRAAPIVAAHAGAVRGLGAFALGDYGALGSRRHRWYATVASVAVGGVTHLVWDGLAHPPGAPGWANNLLPFLNQPSIRGWWWWDYGQVVSSVIGSVIAIALFRRIGRRRLIRAWDGPAPAVALRPGLFWSIALAALTLELASWPIQNYRTTYPVQGVRALWALCLGLLAATAVVAWNNRSPRHVSPPSGTARRTLPADRPPPRTSRPESPSAVR